MLFPVYAGRHTVLFFEYPAEIIVIGEAALFRYGGNRERGIFQELPGMTEAQAFDVFRHAPVKELPGIIIELPPADVQMVTDTFNGQISAQMSQDVIVKCKLKILSLDGNQVFAEYVRNTGFHDFGRGLDLYI